MQSRFTSDTPAEDGGSPRPTGDFVAALRRSDAAAMLPLVEHAFDGVVLVESRTLRVLYANPAFVAWPGRRAADVVGCPLFDLLDGLPSSTLSEQLRRVAGGELAEAALTANWPSQNEAPIDIRLCRLIADDEPVVGIILRKPETPAGKQQDRPVHTADNHRRDPLTGLADRAALLARLQALIVAERAADRQFAVLFIDLDNFKQVNDAHGHLAGDRALSEVARRLARCVRGGDTVARFGGDEFVVLLEQVAQASDVHPVIDRIHAALSEPLTLPDGEVTLAVSIGVAHTSPEHQTAEDLLAEADRAMYAAKRK